jgi:putative heme-binding domain-containing protein
MLRFESSGTAARADLERGFVEPGGRPPAGAELFGIAEIHVDEPREVELVLGSDERLDLWIAGELVHSSAEHRRWSPDQERVAVQLGAGTHQLVVRVDASARFSVAVLGRDDGPFFDDAPAPSQAEDGATIEAYRTFALESPGDSSRGFQLFRDSRRLACLRCHTIASPRGRLGDRVGPDLDRVAERLDRAALVEALLEPSRSVAGDYRAETIRTVRGELVFGQVTSEERGRLTLYDAAGESRTIPLNQIAERRPSRRSVMPAWAYTRVSLQEFADLVEFLETLGRASGGGKGESRTERQR